MTNDTYKNYKILFSVIIILFWFSLYIYVPQLSNYAKELGASYRLIGLIGSAYGFSQTILRLPLGILSDKLRNRKKFVLVGIIAAITSSTMIFLFPNPYSLLIARFIAGIASATWVNFTVLYISYYNSDESNKAVG
ncbi:MAG: MFS transporter, partial [Tissierellia bacterium]|nr:MFS transporter [Tissierellia bacterium]